MKHDNLKVAIVYDRVNKRGGAERVLLALHKIFPQAPLYTSVYDGKNASWAGVFPEVYTSFLQKIPFARRNHEYLPFLMPFAFVFFDFSGYDLVISVTSEFAKNINTKKGTVHVCYCLTPTRYLWSGYKQYFANPIFALITYPVVQFLRIMDRLASKKPDVFIGISGEVKRRIRKYYKRNSQILFPPVDVKIDKKIRGKRSGYYLLVSRLDYGYKKVDLAIKTFNKLGKKLIIVGTGRQMARLKKNSGQNIKFAGWVNDAKLKEYYKKAKALIMPQEEDFGLVAVEAQMNGLPVIAFNKGGACDTVIDGKTGILFRKQDAENLIAAVRKFENTNFKVDNLLAQASKFSLKNFKRDFGKIIENELRS